MNTCGHLVHEKILLNVSLRGKNPILHDVPAFGEEFELDFRLFVYDWKLYRNTVGYCAGDDVLAQSVELQGVWEAFETLLFIDILKRGNGKNLVIDIGANVGWYSVIAGRMGYKVKAHEGDEEIAEVLKDNAKLNDVEMELDGEFISTLSKREIAPIDGEVEFMKCDIEGSEMSAFRKYADYFKEKKVKYAMFEISPVFNGSYPVLLESVEELGYKVFKVPQKGMKYMEEYEVNPLGSVLKYELIRTNDWVGYLKDVRQEDYLFVRSDLA